MMRRIAMLAGMGTGMYFLLRERGRRAKVLDYISHAENWTDMKRRSVRVPQWTGRWTPTSRFLAGATGGAMMYHGMRRHGLLGAAMTATGAGLIARGASNRATREVFGMKPVVVKLRRRAA